MADNDVEAVSGTGIPDAEDPKSPNQPAPGADDQQPEPTEVEATPEVVEDTPEQQEAKKQSKFQRRLERQKTARIAAEVETRLLREQIAKLEAGTKARPEGSAEPKRDQFDDYESYLRAISKYEAAQVTGEAIRADRESRRSQESNARVEVSEERVAQDWIKREAQFASVHKDYQETLAAFVEDGEVAQLAEVARRSILESEVGPQLIYHLAKNLDDAERIAELSPARQITELAKLELKMSPVGRKVSSAPAPIKGVSQGRSAAHGFSENMSDQEYKEWRKGQGARWAR